MAEKDDIKEKTREIYEVLPHLDDQRCGYKTCGAFARAVAKGEAPCYGCVSGGPDVAARVCEIMGAKVPEGVMPQSGTGPGLGRGRGMSIGRGRGRGRGIGRGFGRGRRRR